MTTDAFDSNRLLAEIGITEQEEQAYRLLLARGALALHEIRAALQGAADAQVAQLLAALESKGLVMRMPDAEQRFLASPPEVAIEALVLQKQVTLERTRMAIAWLVREGEPSPHAPATHAVEIVSGRGSLRRAQELLYAAAQSELRCLIPAAGMLGAGLDGEHARAPGVRCLRVVDSAAIQDGTAVEHFCGPVAPLDESRFAQSLPLAVMIADWRLALLPLEAHNPQGAALLVRPSALLDGLRAMFEMVWSQATPVGFPLGTPAAAAGDARSSLSSELEALIPLLAAGLNDKAIAHRLHISVRTLIRRVTKLLTVLDARSRFQAGWASALRLHGITVPNNAPAELSVPEGAANGIKGGQPAQRRAH